MASENKEEPTEINDKSAEPKTEAFTHLAQGKRHLLVGDYDEAVRSFADACALMVKLYGETANECGEVYLNYGTALLELARTENGVLGMEGGGGDKEDSEDEDEEKPVEGGKEPAENGKDGKQESETSVENSEAENGTNKDQESSEKTEDADDADAAAADAAADDDEDDVSNLHLAWEILELAKIIFQRQSEGNKQMELKLAEVYLKLGEVGLESETYSQAIEDIKACLEIRKRVLEEHDRCIAETYYQLGMAYSLINEFDDAITNFTLAHTLLEKRIQLLQEKMKQGEKAEQSEANPFYTLQGEINELNNLLPEVKEKISDIQDFKKETKKALYARIGSGDSQSSNSGQSTSSAFPDAKMDSKPATDISHLVRKKRKPEPDSSEEKCPKQPCLEGAKAE